MIIRLLKKQRSLAVAEEVVRDDRVRSLSGAIILVVEDEPLLRMIAVDILEEAGFAVLEAADAAEAKDILERRGDVGFVFTDVHMPGPSDGMKLAAMVRDRWPGIEIIITSGKIDAQSIDLPSRGVFMPKPYRPAELISTLQAMAA